MINLVSFFCKRYYKLCLYTFFFFLTFLGNLLLTDVYERYYVDLEYGEEYRGVYLIRGENVVLVGELVKTKADKNVKNLS